MEKNVIKRYIFFGIAIVVVVVLACVGTRVYRWEMNNFTSKDGESHGYFIQPDEPLDSVLTRISADYEIASKRAFLRDSRRAKLVSAKPGYYRFERSFGNRHIIRTLQLGNESPVRLTFTNTVRTREQLAGRLAAQLMLDSVSILRCLEDNDYMAQFGLNRETAVCLFLPDTYEVYWTMTTDELFGRMKKEYDAFWTPERIHKADSLHLTPTEVATLASIVESETHREAGPPAIASLYLNRLRKGIALQACPTVIFATGNLKLRRVLKSHLAIDSPYNTYKYPGLPPGPIRCARKHTIDVVLNAPNTGYLFMCANPDFSGTHVFSKTYAQHAAVAQQYRRQLDQRAIH